MTVYEDGKTYRAKIVKWGMSEAKTGTAQVFFNCLIENEIKGEDLLDCPEYERTIFLPITEKAIGFTVAKLQKLGYDKPSFDELDPGHANAFDFAGIAVDIRCKHDEYQGKVIEKWDFSGGGFEGQPVEKTKVSKLNAAFGHFLKNNAKAPAAKTQPRATAAAKTGSAEKTALEKEAEDFL